MRKRGGIPQANILSCTKPARINGVDEHDKGEMTSIPETSFYDKELELGGLQAESSLQENDYYSGHKEIPLDELMPRQSLALGKEG